MILLFTDFGPLGPYTGQMLGVLKQQAPNTVVIPLLNDAPTVNPVASAYLLAALRHDFPADSIFLAIVDPGVGSVRKPVVLCADGQYFVGPDNGLFNTVAVQSKQTAWWEITWRPGSCSNSFHGRDVFAPIAAALAENRADDMMSVIDPEIPGHWPADLAQIIYFDHYGNAMTGMRYSEKLSGKTLSVNGVTLRQAETFSAVEKGEAFWYENSVGLVEIAVNQGSAQDQLSLKSGYEIHIQCTV